MVDDHVLAVITAYPQVYHACHRQHPRTRSGRQRLNVRDEWILGHLSRTSPTSPGRLAKHLAMSPSTVSEAVHRLERLGCVSRRPVEGDRRRHDLFLTDRGAEVLAGSSVLDRERVRRMLAQLPAADRARAAEGLALLAQAARALNQKEPTRWDDAE